MNQPSRQSPPVRRLAITVRGVVQGVGFRPFVYNAARVRELTGWVRNEADMVRIEVQGGPENLDAFVDALRSEHPPQATIDVLEVEQMPCRDGQQTAFEILHSEGRSAPRPTIPADLATCAECLEEIRTPAERRHGYPFTNCTNCGPRWSIIRSLPYDRPRTSMAGFAMCPDCQAEYEDPTDRRFHAQPIACPACGPKLELIDPSGKVLAMADDALSKAAGALLDGRVLALKGLGGFQLLVDATDADAVARLRTRKRRPDRPLAVMLPLLEEVRQRCELSPQEAAALASPQAPILLLRLRSDAEACRDVAEGVAPGNPDLGVMLPYTPLHHLLASAVGRPVVCTSGNLSEEPMATETDDAIERLGSIADLLLVHDRPIVRPVDDSVARVGPDGLQVLRRARGFAPLPIELAGDDADSKRTILAVGGHLKNTVALALGAQVILSPHVGDLDSALSVEVHRRAVRDLVGFFEVEPDVVACDLHPDYASTRFAEALAAEWDVPLLRVQHHHAHVAACMAEHGLTGPVLGLSFDGTGYGTDQTVWGGEMLLCEGAEFRRLAHLRQFALPGGDRAVREPRRSALGLLFEILCDDVVQRLPDSLFAPSELKPLLAMLARGVHCPRTSSLGRLFDAVAALCGLPAVISFEGQAAMALEFAADAGEEAAYPLPVRQPDGSGPAIVDWEPLVRAVLEDLAAGEPVGQISARFHNALAEMAVAVARQSGCDRVVLSGGCFQNALLADRVRCRLLQAGFNVYTHSRVPPGDGGIALGQIRIAAERLAAASTEER